MNINELAALICHNEKGKKQSNIAEVKDILARLGELMASDPEIEACFLKYAKRRYAMTKRKGKK